MGQENAWKLVKARECPKDYESWEMPKNSLGLENARKITKIDWNKRKPERLTRINKKEARTARAQPE